MATYNGEKYIRQQLDSLLNQTYQNFVIYINDDCSTDETYAILEEYKQKYSDKIELSKSVENSGSAKFNFINMMIKHKSEYIMLCDQDDVWLENKVELSLKAIKKIEEKLGKQTPILVHTDLIVVDDGLNVKEKSFKKAMNANYDRTTLQNIVIQNTLTGCTAIYNQALSSYIKTIPKFTVMHDWWLMIICSAFGTIGHIDEQTILYRQHADNSIGAKNVNKISYKLDMLKKREYIKNALDETYSQAEAFLDAYKNELTEQQVAFLKEYIAIKTKCKLSRIYALFKLRTFKNGFSRRLAQILFI